MIILYLFRLSLLCVVALLSVTAQAGSAPVLILERSASRLELAPWLDVLPATDTPKSSEQLLVQPDVWPWRALQQPVLAQGYRGDGLWLRLKTQNSGLPQRRILEFNRTNLSHIEVITRRSDGAWQTRTAGTAELSPQGDINGLGYSFAVVIPEGTSSIYVRLRSAYPLATPIHLSTENTLLRASQNSAAVYGAGLGLLGGVLLGVMGLRSARLTLRVRWIFTALIASVILRALADRGVLGYWWLDVPGSLHSITQLSGCLLSIAHVLLCREFLGQRQALTPRFQSLLLTVILANLIWMLISVAWLPNQWLPIADALRWFGLSVIIAALWQPAQQGIPGANWYRAVMLTGIVGQALNDAALRGWLPFWAEPYQSIVIWHLLAAPLLLHALEQPIKLLLPAQKQNTPIPLQAVAVPARLKPGLIRVLVVEDNPWVQQVLAGLLLKLDCHATLASDGRAAIGHLQVTAFDLVLMDCDLPELDGFSTTQLWRASNQAAASSRQVPIIAITAHISAYHEVQAHEAGMNDFLQKPIDMRTLHEMLTRWLPHYAA